MNTPSNLSRLGIAVLLACLWAWTGVSAEPEPPAAAAPEPESIEATGEARISDKLGKARAERLATESAQRDALANLAKKIRGVPPGEPANVRVVLRGVTYSKPEVLDDPHPMIRVVARISVADAATAEFIPLPSESEPATAAPDSPEPPDKPDPPDPAPPSETVDVIQSPPPKNAPTDDAPEPVRPAEETPQETPTETAAPSPPEPAKEEPPADSSEEPKP